MYKKEIFRDLDKKYNSHLYSGLLGILMKYCHRKLEVYKSKKDNYDKILEIGAGSAPHFNFMKCLYNEYHIAETSDFAEDFHKNNPKVKLLKYDGRNLPYQNETFDRIIISHCLEHILSPEEFIQEMMSKLKKNGVLSISLPTDPGIAWRLGRLFIRLFTIKKTYQISGEEFNYMNATEHVNSIFNLISIIRFNYKNQYEEYFYPMRLKMADLNLFYNVHITKKN
ncbi:class I SAM-dependent methyltransferase [Candidatus Pelagibacter ubique]|nr:class I SAM-dependent methyltransferase [Candidatus Pelagibacter ubique]